MGFSRFSHLRLWNVYETIIRIYNCWNIICVKNALDFERQYFFIFLFQGSVIDSKEMCKISATSF